MSTSDEFTAPFSSELMSDKTMNEINELRSNSAYTGYNPNEDTDARELGGDTHYVPVGSGMMPFSVIVMLYILRKVVKMKFFSKTI